MCYVLLCAFMCYKVVRLSFFSVRLSTSMETVYEQEER